MNAKLAESSSEVVAALSFEDYTLLQRALTNQLVKKRWVLLVVTAELLE